MRLATINTSDGPRLHVRGRSGYVDVATESGEQALRSLTGLLAGGVATFDVADRLSQLDGREYADTELAAAVPEPNRILCLGLNYREHALEGGREVPTWPESFVRGRGSVLAPFADLVKPAFCQGFDYEGELGVVIGAGGRYLSADKALAAVAGFTVLNDASAREWQRAGSQWTPGKNFDGSMPIGPEVVTTNELDVTNLALTTRLNGMVMQAANTSQMIVDVASAVEFFSSFTTLMPGDVIATGTPGGVGFARTPPVWLTPGDVVEVEIEGIGTIRNTVVAEQHAPHAWRWAPVGAATGVL
ncbi:MAG TPA: fumarylacetoacetate hydrolase family protein [Pseudonocardiaceae bacterium]|nr:fumarylacetoacetate hydrolase family protein [Pseudonocardiaceae bacterium]